MEKNIKKEYIYIYTHTRITESLCYTAVINNTAKQLYFIQIKKG